MAMTTFNVDERMEQSLEELKKHFGASSKAEVIRKAIALLKVVTDSEDADGSITIQKKDGKEQKLIIR
ncbi:MAG TPA: hypothetical protein VGB27_01720 [Candidatus Binatia bacterium]